MNKLITGLILIGTIGLVGCGKLPPELHIGYTQNISKEANYFYFDCMESLGNKRICNTKTFTIYAGADGKNTIKYFHYPKSWAYERKFNSSHKIHDYFLTPCTEAKTKEEKNVCGLELKNE